MSFVRKARHIKLLFLLKTGIGSALAIILAESLMLAYSPSAGIITLLTIQNTKKETIQIALKRIIAFFLAIIIALLIFRTFSFTPIAFGGFVLIFVALCILLGLQDGIAMNAVLTTHFLIEKRIDMPLIINEIMLLLIGMGIGIIFNLIMPKYREKIRKEQKLLEEEMKTIMKDMSKLLIHKDACLIQKEQGGNLAEENDRKATDKAEGEPFRQVDFTQFDNLLEELLKKAYEDAGNTLLSNTKYHVSYLEMRKLQIEVLKDITDKINSIPVILRQAFPISQFMEHTANSFHEMNNALDLLDELACLQEHYRNDQLPQTREEFEYRAILFQIMKELEYFLVLKRNFVIELEKKNMKRYWT